MNNLLWASHTQYALQGPATHGWWRELSILRWSALWFSNPMIQGPGATTSAVSYYFLSSCSAKKTSPIIWQRRANLQVCPEICTSNVSHNLRFFAQEEKRKFAPNSNFWYTFSDKYKVLKCFQILSVFFTCFFDVCAFLVHGGAQRRRTDVQHTDLFHTGVENPQCVVLLLVIVTKNLTIDKRGKHLSLQEAWEKWQVGLWLVRQEGGLHMGEKLWYVGYMKRNT